MHKVVSAAGKAQVDLDPRSYRLHSLQSGGATAAANVGVPDTVAGEVRLPKLVM